MTIVNQIQVDDEKLSPPDVIHRVFELLFLCMGNHEMPDLFEVINKTVLLEHLLLDSDPFMRAAVMMICLLTYFVRIEGLDQLQDELTSTREYLIEEYKKRVNLDNEPSLEA